MEKLRFGYCTVNPCEMPSTPPPVSVKPVTTTPVNSAGARNSNVTGRPGVRGGGSINNTLFTTTPSAREVELLHTDMGRLLALLGLELN